MKKTEFRVRSVENWHWWVFAFPLPILPATNATAVTTPFKIRYLPPTFITRQIPSLYILPLPAPFLILPSTTPCLLFLIPTLTAACALSPDRPRASAAPPSAASMDLSITSLLSLVCAQFLLSISLIFLKRRLELGLGLGWVLLLLLCLVGTFFNFGFNWYFFFSFYSLYDDGISELLLSLMGSD